MKNSYRVLLALSLAGCAHNSDTSEGGRVGTEGLCDGMSSVIGSTQLTSLGIVPMDHFDALSFDSYPLESNNANWDGKTITLAFSMLGETRFVDYTPPGASDRCGDRVEQDMSLEISTVDNLLSEHINVTAEITTQLWTEIATTIPRQEIAGDFDIDAFKLSQGPELNALSIFIRVVDGEVNRIILNALSDDPASTGVPIGTFTAAR